MPSDEEKREINISGDFVAGKSVTEQSDPRVRRGGSGVTIQNQGNSGGVNIRSGQTTIKGDVFDGDKVTGGTQNKTIVHGDQIGGDKVGGDKFGGDKVGGDKITAGRDVVKGNQTTGASADEFARAFAAIYDKIKQRPDEDERTDLTTAVDKIQTAVKQTATSGEEPDETAAKEVRQAAQTIVATEPALLDDVLEVASTTLQNPAAGVLTVIRKVIEKARQARAAGAV